VRLSTFCLLSKNLICFFFFQSIKERFGALRKGKVLKAIPLPLCHAG